MQGSVLDKEHADALNNSAKERERVFDDIPDELLELAKALYGLTEVENPGEEESS